MTRMISVGPRPAMSGTAFMVSFFESTGSHPTRGVLSGTPLGPHGAHA
jgi:hypothetical protein